ncbi:MAG: HPr(Ser) kinase/phosphatase [Kiritimatiellae bacterium]|nr:HPr(Ser) kinase/phosphatase [Kiritimatiellia bacterium]
MTVRQFVEGGRRTLELEVFDGEDHLDRVVPEPAINRPGLALAGFLRYFAHRRIQVIGLAELTYLKGLAPEERLRRLTDFFQAEVPCVVFARSIRPPPEVRELAAQHRVPLLRSHLITGRFVQLAAVVIEDLTAPRMRYQGTMVDIMGIGVIIEGPPGVGKSETALSLIARGHSLVADDMVDLRRLGVGEILGTAPDLTRYHMEIRGLGLIHVPSLYGLASVRREKRVDMIVRLERVLDGTEEERTGLEQKTRDVLGVEIPYYRIPVVAGRDISLVVEAAALNFRLRQLGHDAAKELDERIMARLTRERIRSSD